MLHLTQACANVHADGTYRIAVENLPVSPEQAHAVADQPFVDCAAVAYTTAFNHNVIECEWLITVVAFVDQEAHALLDETLGALLDDIATGRIERGTHRGCRDPDPWGRTERELGAFRSAMLRDLAH